MHAAAALSSFSAIGDQERARFIRSLQDFLVPAGSLFSPSYFFLPVCFFRPSSFLADLSTAWTAGRMAGSGSSALRSAKVGTVRMIAPAQKNPDVRFLPACGTGGD